MIRHFEERQRTSAGKKTPTYLLTNAKLIQGWKSLAFTGISRIILEIHLKSMRKMLNANYESIYFYPEMGVKHQ